MEHKFTSILMHQPNSFSLALIGGNITHDLTNIRSDTFVIEIKGRGQENLITDIVLVNKFLISISFQPNSFSNLAGPTL